METSLTKNIIVEIEEGSKSIDGTKNNVYSDDTATFLAWHSTAYNFQVADRMNANISALNNNYSLTMDLKCFDE
jgi:hypothetical protein